MNNKYQELLLAIENFINAKDRSIKAANTIEGLIADFFPDDEKFEDTVIALASYRPRGGDYLHDESIMTNILIQAKNELMRQAKHRHEPLQ